MNWKILSVLFIATHMYADIGGVVYKDLPIDTVTLNSYGIKDNNEQGIEGISVTIHLNDGNESTVLTDVNGKWSYKTDENKLRVEFSGWSNYLTESIKGADNKNSAVRFVNNNDTNITFGLYDVNDYLKTTNPDFVTTLIINGDSNNSEFPSLIINKYRDKGLNSNFSDTLGNVGNGEPYVVSAKNSETGATWGIAYHATKKRAFVASALWRHSGNYENKLGYIFVADYNNNGKIIGKIDLEGVNGIELGDVNRSADDFVHQLSTGPLEPNVDVDAYSKVGKVSFGDLDFDEKTQTLWVVNLYQQSIIRMDASSDDLDSIESSAKQYFLKDINGVPSCSGGELRPWAFAINEGKGYVGMICDASISQNREDLKAYLSSFDLSHPENGLTTELVINMNYDRKTNADGEQGNQFYFPWSDEFHQTISYIDDYFWDYYNQPILTDIEFDEKGNAYLSFTDRYTLQIGYQNYPADLYPPDLLSENIEAFGEIFKACNIDGKLELEGTGSCDEGNSRNGDVDFFDDKGGDNNANSIGGALALIPGSYELLSTVNSPHPDGEYGKEYWDLTGLETFSTKDGNILNWNALLNAAYVPYHGKGVGLGDVEFLTNEAPIEVGDRIWLDSNGNGKQDVYERGIEGIGIDLLSDNKVIASAVSDSEGNYLFSSDMGEDSASQKYNISELKANHSYLLHLSNSIDNLSLTVSNNRDGANILLYNSDAKSNGTVAEVSFTPKVGENIHSLDIGYKPEILLDIRHDNVVAVDSATEERDCNCSAYTEDSIAIFDNKMIIFLIFVLNLLLVLYLHEEFLEEIKGSK
jgi:hypothetical protein